MNGSDNELTKGCLPLFVSLVLILLFARYGIKALWELMPLLISPYDRKWFIKHIITAHSFTLILIGCLLAASCIYLIYRKSSGKSR